MEIMSRDTLSNSYCIRLALKFISGEKANCSPTVLVYFIHLVLKCGFEANDYEVLQLDGKWM